MSAFRPKNVAAPRAGSGAKRDAKSYPRSRLIVVEGYDLARQVIIGTDLGNEKFKIEATVDDFEKAQLPDGYLNCWYLGREPEKRWSNLRDKLNVRLFDAAHMLGPAAIAATLGPKSQHLARHAALV